MRLLRQGIPLMAHSTDRVLTLNSKRGGAETRLGLGIKLGLRGNKGASQGFYIHGELSLNLSLN